MTAEFPIEEIEDRELYLKYIKSQDVLIPVPEMIRRCEKEIDVHEQLIATTNKDSLEWKWRSGLLTNAYKRLNFWTRS